MSTTTTEVTKAAELPDAVRPLVRDLVLVLADSKRLLGMRFGNWILGAPELEAGIACASMAQDEWGHARLLYAMLREFDENVEQLEHGREPAQYRCMGALDAEPESWPELVALNVLVDGAITTQLEALTESSYVPLRQRVQKLIDEEQFHSAHGAAWLRRIAGAGDAGRTAAQDAVARHAPAVLAWFGPDTGRGDTLVQSGIAAAAGSALRARFVERIAPLLQQAGLDTSVLHDEPDFANWDEVSRRVTGTMPDDRTIAQVRGDRNRAFLMD